MDSDLPRVREASIRSGEAEASLEELVAYLREKRSELRERWASRIGQAKRIYYNTLLDENAAAHIAFGSGFGATRSETPARGVNRSTIHLDVMIGSPKLEATGVNARGRRIPLIREGAWQI